MLTRLKVNGFKNLVGVDVHFGPFTCIAGANGVGKSNLFDAIRFLSALADKPLIEAAMSVRNEGVRSADLRSIFHKTSDRYEHRMSFEAEMLVPAEGVDDLGQEATATTTFLRYELSLELVARNLVIRKEALSHINKSQSRAHLPFPHRPAWRSSVVRGRRTNPFISTESVLGEIFIKLHQDGSKGSLGGGRARSHVAERLPRTVLSGASNAADSPTAVLARREIQSWRLLQLEPSALRAPDSYDAPASINATGAHLPATLARLARWRGGRTLGEDRETEAWDEDHAASIYAQVANRLAELIRDVHSVRIEADDSREVLKLVLRDLDGTEHEAGSLSDGTLRFLALTILEHDPSTRGVLCLEEPENGIHPERIPAILRLLRDLGTDPSIAADEDNTLRQVIVNTHSPSVVAQVDDDDLLLVVPEVTKRDGERSIKPVFRWLENTWRARVRQNENVTPLPPGHVVTYLNPIDPVETESKTRHRVRRVIDRPDIQPFVPSSSPSDPQ